LLAALTEILRERDALGPGGEPSYSIALVSELVANIRASTHNGAFFHIRLKRVGDSPVEYANLCNAWQTFPRHAPEPLGQYFEDDWEIIVVRGIRHRLVSRGSVARDSHGVVREIVSFLEASGTGARVAEPVESHREFLQHVLERATDSTCAAIVREWITNGRLDVLPHIRQHCDFVIGNLGLTADGLVVFDWEDFGRIELPGFDLCTLLASDAGLDANRLFAIIRGGDQRVGAYAELLERGCPAIDMRPDLFRQLIPLYLVIFLDLKRAYGKAIRGVISGLIRDIQAKAFRKP